MLDAFYLSTDAPSDGIFYDHLAYNKETHQLLQTTL
jgi:hypothetical protein